MIPAHQIILVVEDHDFQRRLLVRLFESLGASTVVGATQGRAALDLIEREGLRPTLVVCDLDMPEMDGLAFIRHLGQRLPATPVIVTSAVDPVLLGPVAKMADAYGVRLVGVLEKPISRAQLVQAVGMAFEPTAVTRPARTTTPPPEFGLAEIEAAIAHGEFEPFFQPKVSFASGRVVGAEALARWRHPERGLIGPYAFVLVLENARRIDALTFAMIEKSALAGRRWHDMGIPLKLSVNLSLTSLGEPDLADRIAATVLGAGFDPRGMVLEVTETAAMTDLAPALENLTRLRMKGFGLSIDDYGTGFASMQQLARVPYTELKVDQGFVTGCSKSRNALVIVEASLALARGLKLTTVAEGIETADDWETLRGLGCDVAQGYYIAKPMQEDEFIAFCKRRGTGSEASQ